MSKARPASRIAEIPPNQLSSLQAAMTAKLLRGQGRLPTPYKVWLHSASLARHLEALDAFLTKQTSLTRRETEIGILVAAAHWRSEYAFGVHAREARTVGLSEEVIEAIRYNRDATLEMPREQIVFDLARSLADAQPATDDLFNRAVRSLGHVGVAELLALFGYFTSVSVAMKLYRVTAAG